MKPSLFLGGKKLKAFIQPPKQQIVYLTWSEFLEIGLFFQIIFHLGNL